MKKSEKIKFAMMAVLDSISLCASTKLEVIEFLMNEKSIAEWVEEDEAKCEAKRKENWHE